VKQKYQNKGKGDQNPFKSWKASCKKIIKKNYKKNENSLQEKKYNGNNEDTLKAWINKERTRKKNCYESLDQQEGEDHEDNGDALKAWINKEERIRKKKLL
jgi:hypothetical protein